MVSGKVEDERRGRDVGSESRSCSVLYEWTFECIYKISWCLTFYKYQLCINNTSKIYIMTNFTRGPLHGVTVANQLSARFVKKLAPLTLVGLAVFVTLHLSCRLPAASILAPT